MTLGQSLIAVRKKLSLSQREAAVKIGTSAHHLNEIENGNADPSMRMLQNIAKVYNLPVPILLWGMAKEEDVKPELVAIYRQMKPDIDELIETVYFNNK